MLKAPLLFLYPPLQYSSFFPSEAVGEDSKEAGRPESNKVRENHKALPNYSVSEQRLKKSCSFILIK